jgi:hypothetical protein
MKIYSSIFRHKQSGTQMLNLIHCHLDDSSEEATLEVVHLNPDPNVIEDFKEFKNDA